jgi:hypothetical protein
MNYHTANQYSLVLFVISLVILTVVFSLKKQDN